MKHLLSYFKPYIKESILAPLFKLLEAVFELLVPMVIAGIVDQSLPQGDQGHLWMQIGLLLIFAVIGVLVALIAQFYSAKAAVGFAKELTNDLYRHILSLPKDSRDRLTTSSLVTRLTSDTYQIQTGINQFLRLFLRAPIIVFGAIFMAYRISTELTFWFLVMVAILTIVIVGLSRLVNPLYSSLRKKTDQLVQETRQQLQGMRVIRAFGQEKRELQIFQTLNQVYARLQEKTGFWSSLLTPLTYLIVNGTLLVIIWQGYISIQGGVLSQNGRSPLNLEQWRSWIAYVPQKVKLFKGTIRSNLTLGLNQEVSDQKLWQALEIAQAKDFVSEKEGLLDALVEAGGRNFSGGQKQRLSIARAVLRQAPFIILDDATSALDTITESKLLKAIRENFPNTSLILISQRTSTLQMADQILLLEKGELLAVGKHDDLMKSSQVYREINASQHGKED